MRHSAGVFITIRGLPAHPDRPGFHLGAIARGTGKPGQSRLYTSFNRTLIDGIYNGKPLPDKINHISLNTF